MSEYIEVSTEKLAYNVSDMCLDIETAEPEMKDIYDAVTVLNTMWTGPANSQFNESFHADGEAVLSSLQRMKNFLSRLDECRKKYEQCESEIGDEVHSMN